LYKYVFTYLIVVESYDTDGDGTAFGRALSRKHRKQSFDEIGFRLVATSTVRAPSHASIGNVPL